jgi:homoserine dehydrogenase
MEKIYIGILGYNSNTEGLLSILKDNENVIKNKTGYEILIKKIFINDLECNINSLSSLYNNNNIVVSNDPFNIVNDKDIKIIVETLDNVKLSKDLIIKIIESNKTPIISNKALLSKYGKDIFSKAFEYGINIGFESCVGGGIPIIDVVKEDLIGNNIKEIYAILSGTSNYILTKLENDENDLNNLIEEVKSLGYSEYDPNIDINGLDSAYKIAILSMIAFKKIIPFEKIYIRGIKDIDKLDIDFAEQLGCKIKLLSIAKNIDGKLDIRVEPTMLPKKYMLAKVRDEFNAIYIKSDMVGNTIHYGRGAGGKAIGSALCSDVVSAMRDLKHCNKMRTPPLGYFGDYNNEANIVDHLEIVSPFYLRFIVIDKPGVLATIAGVLGKNNISISAAIQPEVVKESSLIPLVFLTHVTKALNIKMAVEEINSLDIVHKKAVVVRVEK